ncbi:hypothetical protein FRC0484_01387 [Corynebacterium diphtheriae]|nr:hypothetical protein FRC0484_01387 [Corynebacterium diphtheriae]
MARIASFDGIHRVVLVDFSFVDRVIAEQIASATMLGVTDIGAGFIPRVMCPITKPGRAMIIFTELP